MTTAPRRPAARRKPVTPPVAATAIDVIDDLLADVTAGGLHWPASDAEAAPIGHAWAREFMAVPFVSTIEPTPIVAGYLCPTCDTRYYSLDTVCGQGTVSFKGQTADFHEPAKVVPV